MDLNYLIGILVLLNYLKQNKTDIYFHYIASTTHGKQCVEYLKLLQENANEFTNTLA